MTIELLKACCSHVCIVTLKVLQTSHVPFVYDPVSLTSECRETTATKRPLGKKEIHYVLELRVMLY